MIGRDQMKSNKFKFIDLFAGVGGFHQAATQLGGECVFASEIDKFAIETYKKNYGIDSAHDITEVDEKDIPAHDLLCAGFPCQAFSKAGKQNGLEDTRGTLFFDIQRILKHHRTKYIVLENVRNLVSHDSGRTWAIIQKNLKQLGYRLTKDPIILSPHHFGVPQLRERVYILGVYEPENVDKPLNIEFDNLLKKEDNTIDSIIQKRRASEKYYIDDYETKVLEIWNEFYQGIDMKIIGFPVWVKYFNTKIDNTYPKWKKEIIDRNQRLYQSNKEFIDKWLHKHNNLEDLAVTHRKFEWQAGESIKNIWEGIIQFRPSGVRVKRPDTFPALVAIVQIPIIGKYKRRLTLRECANLQSFSDDYKFISNDSQSYKQLGNSVNVKVINTLVEMLFTESV